MERMTIIRNSAKCRKCNDEIESTHRHDFVKCKCGEIFVDGGKAYIRRGAQMSLANIIDTSETSANEPMGNTVDIAGEKDN